MYSVDIIIPLGIGSQSGNDELRIMLRSLAANGINYRNIIIAATAPPEWLRDVNVVPMDDPLPRNKDGNIIRKVLTAAGMPGVSEEIAVCWDDNAFLSTFDFATIPPIFNRRGKDRFPADGSIWQRRVRRTFEMLESRGVSLTHNFESHTPHRYNTKKLLQSMQTVDYTSDIGYSIDTLFHGMLGITGGWSQSLFKETVEKNSSAQFNKMMIGYNDDAFLGGLREQLFERFPEPCRYEIADTSAGGTVPKIKARVKKE